MRNTFVKDSVSAKCRRRGPLFINNIILGSLKLDDDVQFGSRNIVEERAEVFVGPGSKIGDDCTFHGTVTIGEKSTIASQTALLDANVKNKVTIGMGSKISGILEDGVIIGTDCSIGSEAVVEAAAEMGASSKLGNGSRIATKKKIGVKSCVGSKVKVVNNLPDKYYLNSGEKPKKGFAVLVNGKCEPATE